MQQAERARTALLLIGEQPVAGSAACATIECRPGPGQWIPCPGGRLLLIEMVRARLRLVYIGRLPMQAVLGEMPEMLRSIETYSYNGSDQAPWQHAQTTSVINRLRQDVQEAELALGGGYGCVNRTMPISRIAPWRSAGSECGDQLPTDVTPRSLREDS